LQAKQIVRLALLFAAFSLSAFAAETEQAQGPKFEAALPESPQPQVHNHAGATVPEPCVVKIAGAVLTTAAAESAVAASGAGNGTAGSTPHPTELQVSCPPLLPLIDWYARFLNGPQVKPLTPKEKGWLAIRNVGDPFNVVTVLGEAGISVGSNADSPYGPGMKGFGRYAGASFAQDMTGEFFGTFLIPSIVHQDPHYHRMPNASITRRAIHAFTQVEWTRGDNGKEMVNYADLVGFAVDDEIANLYVPGRSTNLPASAARYGTGLATAPIDNFVSEFLPDVARQIHVQIVVIQRIINQVAKVGPSTSTTSSTGSQ